MYRRFGKRGDGAGARAATDQPRRRGCLRWNREIFAAEQIDVRFNFSVKACEGAAQWIHLLIATGRRPNTDDLGLERTSIARDERGYIEWTTSFALPLRRVGAGRLQWKRRVHAYELQRLRDPCGESAGMATIAG